MMNKFLLIIGYDQLLRRFDLNIADNLVNTAFHFRDRCAVIEAERQISYRQFDTESSRVAAALADAGIRPGDHVALMLSHGNIQTSLFNVSRYERSTQKDRALCFLPLNHVFGQIHITHSMVTCNHYYRHVVGSVGTPVSLIEVQIRDFDGNVLFSHGHQPRDDRGDCKTTVLIAVSPSF